MPRGRSSEPRTKKHTSQQLCWLGLRGQRAPCNIFCSRCGYTSHRRLSARGVSRVGLVYRVQLFFVVELTAVASAAFLGTYNSLRISTLTCGASVNVKSRLSRVTRTSSMSAVAAAALATHGHSRRSAHAVRGVRPYCARVCTEPVLLLLWSRLSLSFTTRGRS